MLWHASSAAQAVAPLRIGLAVCVGMERVVS